MSRKEELDNSRNEIYTSLGSHIESLVGKKINKKELRGIFELSLKLAFTKASETGYLRLPGGLGVIKKVERDKINIHTPYGETVEVPKRFIMKYQCGTFQKELVSKDNEAVSSEDN